MKARPIVFVDTSVWLDRYLPDSANSSACTSFFSYAQLHELDLYYSSPSIKDIFYIFRQRTKRLLAASGATLTADISASIDDTAWSIVSDIRRVGMLATLSAHDLDYAEGLRPVHGDFEDDLIIAAARRANADYLVTNDKELALHSPVVALDPMTMLAVLENQY